MTSGYERCVAAILAVVLLSTCTVVVARESDTWFLMGRHGECAELDSLQRKIPDLGAPRSLDALLESLSNKGFRVRPQFLDVPSGKAAEVEIPELSLSLILVTSELCSEFVEHR